MNELCNSDMLRWITWVLYDAHIYILDWQQKGNANNKKEAKDKDLLNA